MMLSDASIKEETAHYIVYGKMKYIDGKLSDNEIKDPDCVDPKKGIPEKHLIIENIKIKFKEFKKAVRTFMVNAMELINSIPPLIAAIGAQITQAAVALVTPPTFTSGPATVLVMFKTLLSSLTEFLAKLPIILSTISPFSFLASLIPDDLVDLFIAPINFILLTLNTPLDTLTKITGFVTTIVGLFGDAAKAEAGAAAAEAEAADEAAGDDDE